ncbi:hypothetical protein RCL1_001638 [Eukaryota sp. TZLM3-RCL]
MSSRRSSRRPQRSTTSYVEPSDHSEASSHSESDSDSAFSHEGSDVDFAAEEGTVEADSHHESDAVISDELSEPSLSDGPSTLISPKAISSLTPLAKTAINNRKFQLDALQSKINKVLSSNSSGTFLLSPPRLNTPTLPAQPRLQGLFSPSSTTLFNNNSSPTFLNNVTPNKPAFNVPKNHWF